MFDNFKVSNIRRHLLSTLLGVLILGVSLWLVSAGKASYAEVSPVLLLVLPFLLYGKKGPNKQNDGIG